jgi:hypothetical protein
MPRQILPAASLRNTDRLPAARGLVRVANHLIWIVLCSIGRVIFGIGSNFSLLSGRGPLPGGVDWRGSIAEAARRVGRRIGKGCLAGHHFGEQPAGDRAEREAVVGVAEGEP